MESALPPSSSAGSHQAALKHLADLASPLRLPCGAVLSNRIAKAPLTEGLADNRNRATRAHEVLYGRWSEGGSGLVITGNVQVDRRFLERPGNVAIDGNGGFDALRAYAVAGTRAGNHLWMQINHPGRQTPLRIHESPLAPSAVALQLPGFGQPRAMTQADIEDLIERFVRVACEAQRAGFTGVQVHAAHGYLISQFLSPRSNQRTDQWGGSLENRARVLLDIVRGTRAAVGPAFPIGVKLNSADFQKGGFEHEECLQVARWLDDAGIDLLEISGGTYEQPQMVVATRTHGDDALLDVVRESTRKREAYFLGYAAAIRAATKVPLMITGGFRTLAAMEEALAEGLLDVIGLGRPLIVDPSAARKLLDREIEEVSAFERSLRFDKAEANAREVDPAVIAEVKGWGIQSWYCVQLLRIGQGIEPDTNMTVLDAYLQYRASENSAAQALDRS
jgi:2,4-dienoyl-CoA reductase-like NADH-dependent reductase (Old Yellow Enzyme family)